MTAGLFNGCEPASGELRLDDHERGNVHVLAAQAILDARGRGAMCGRRFQIEGLEKRTLLSLTAINFGATVTSTPVVANGELFFAADDSTHGKQLWESNGTAAGTVRLTDGNDANGGINPTDLTAVGNTLYFSAYDGTDGEQLWKSDGTAAAPPWSPTSNDGTAATASIPPT